MHNKIILAFTMLIMLLVLVACGGGGGGSSSTAPVVDDNQADTAQVTYDGTAVAEASTGTDGRTVITSGTSGNSYDIAIEDNSGNPVGDIDVSFYEDGDNAVIYVSDPMGVYSDSLLIGTPAELATASGRFARAASNVQLGVTLTQRTASTVGFTNNAYDLSDVYMGTLSEASSVESGCYTPSEIAATIEDLYTSSMIGSSSILIFSDSSTSSVAGAVKISSSTLSSSISDALTAKMEHENSVTAGALDSEIFRLTCYVPDNHNLFGVVCEVKRASSICEGTNSAPVITGTPATAVTAGSAYSFIPAASDEDGDTLTFSIVNKPSWASFSTSTGELSGTPAVSDAGAYSGIVISATDGTDNTSLSQFSITVAAGNSAPVINGTPAAEITAGNAYSFTPTASDVDDDTLTFSIENKPSWATFNAATGALTGTPATSDEGAYTGIVISVSDGSETASLSSFTITVSVLNSVPTISGTPETTLAEGAAYSFTPTANDADGDTLTFSIENIPSWASFDTATGALTGTPSSSDAGTYSSIQISVVDGNGGEASLTAFIITVTEPAITLYRAGTTFLDPDFIAVSWPYSVSSTVSATILGVSYYTVGTFKLSAAGDNFTISSLSAVDLNSHVVPYFQSLTDGQVIEPGTDVTFKLLSPLTGGSQSNLRFYFTIQETGETFTYNVILQTN
ncbi:Ig family protein [Denitrovibrio acetiphilus DSM 12809]|uniref:Ig family protein n=1 Tax=Denitrovibrio acetiphilus (strain DSM 12809 / NBRC 114555 / N2460) TaxID=522772 RepID=D4H4K1_DENA2|nr:putative Ig domain-containing protein [Denitrovibrio acetiphilus]ADD67395.1 Ig family protein [Denitrovibrio acetiphilus DSM 12809]